jgi:dynamin 1-like protein
MQGIIEVNNLIQKALSDANLKTKIETAQIAVVGAQSSGKTSVLEMILGVDCLPRGSGIVTKCPLKLQLYHHEEEKKYATFEHTPKVFTDFNEVSDEITRRTHELIGDKQTVSNTPIVLRLFSKDVPNLTLIDLPGLTEAATDGQDKSLPDKIRALVRENIVCSKTIILLINPANVDMANNPAIKLIEEVDPRRERTFGVITKLDLMDIGEDARDLIEGKDYALKHGYIAVKSRSQQDNKDGLSIDEAKIKELDFFKSHKVYKNMMSQCGTSTLATKLSLLLGKAIRDELPNTLKLIEENLLVYTEKMNKLGPSLNFKTEEQAYEYLLGMIDNFCKQLKIEIEGGD